MSEKAQYNLCRKDIKHFIEYVEGLLEDPSQNLVDMVFGVGPSDDISRVDVLKARDLNRSAEYDLFRVRSTLEASEFEVSAGIAEALVVLFHIGRRIGYAEAIRKSFESRKYRRHLWGSRKGAERAHGDAVKREQDREEAVRKVEALIDSGYTVGEATSEVAEVIGKAPGTVSNWRLKSSSYRPQKRGRKKKKMKKP
ncbi:MAG: hypothetical protein AAF098_17200 [Pseudomonadota bacterium]